MKLRNVLLAATMLALPGAVQAAQPVSGVYIGGGAGFDYLNTLNGKTVNVPVPGTLGRNVPINTGNLTSNGGFVALASVGYGFGNGLRVEVEGNYRQQHVRTGSTSVGGGGNIQQYGAFVNGVYDFNNVVPWAVPYAGLGVGYVWNEFQNGRLYTTSIVPQLGLNSNNGAQGEAAGQLILGAAFPLGVPGLALTTEFRFLGEFGEPKFKFNVTAGGVQANGARSTIKVGTPTNESFLIGLRYAFNAAPSAPAPAPAPVAAPAPAPARTYLVFFDWDRADLTARARQIIAEAAQNSTRVQYTKIEVAGHADRTGTAAYNLALSRRRADNVAAELVRDGVPKAAIAIQAFGDSKPLVPTGPGVREPQNRRVEIVLK
jgi:outer membrane protein OmpA-like peptidoglycan-associated protein